MIYVGLDDTDTKDSPGTNQLARGIVRALEGRFRCVYIVRHQLLDDPRVPYTSKNGSASIVLEGESGRDLEWLIAACRKTMRDWYVVGSDPGLCVTDRVDPEVVEFGRRCKRELVSQAEARGIARRLGVHLEGLGGTEGGVIGALAAVGLAATGDDGRIVKLGSWDDDLVQVQPVEVVRSRGVELRDAVNSAPVCEGRVDLGKRLRPNLRHGEPVLFVRAKSDSAEAEYEALKMT